MKNDGLTFIEILIIIVIIGIIALIIIPSCMDINGIEIEKSEDKTFDVNNRIIYKSDDKGTCFALDKTNPDFIQIVDDEKCY